jgi:Domain of unknown function (DUF4326)
MPRVYNRRDPDLPEDAVYVGRGRGSKWGYPFRIGRDGTREEVIARYREHLYDSGLIDDVGELHRRDLVCWCAPLPCHADMLFELANSARSSY